MLTIWKSIVHTHAHSNTLLLVSEHQIQRVQHALDELLAECKGLKKDTTLHIALNTDCGILPVFLKRAVELATLHARLLTVHPTHLAAQILSNLISHSLLNTDCITNAPSSPYTGRKISLGHTPPTATAPKDSTTCDECYHK